MVRVPPGRAGRMWLLRRLHTGRHAADLLDRKVRILRTEQRRCQERAAITGQRWRQAWARADRWARRGAALGGRRELRLAAVPEPARVSVAWVNVMGLRYPGEVHCHLPDPDTVRSPGTAALVEAAAAYRDAVRAAAEHAAAEAACRQVAAELATTRRRHRAIADRWVPELEAALRRLTAELDENERAETARLRWASQHQQSAIA